MTSLRRIAYFVLPYRWYLIFGFFTVVLPVLMELVVPRALQFIIDDGIRANDMGAVWQGFLFMFGAAVIGATSAFLQGWCRAAVSQGVAFDLRNTLFAHIQSLSFANLDQMQTGRLMTRVSSDVDTVRMFSSANLALLLRTSLMVIGSFIMLVWTNWQLAMVVLVLLLVAAIFLRILLRIAQPLFLELQSLLGGLNTTIQENLAGIQVVKAFVREKFEISRFHKANQEYMHQNIYVGRILAVGMPALMILTNIGIVTVLWLGGSSVIEGRMSVGELIAFNNYLIIGMMPLLFLSNLLTMVARAEASAERLLEVLETTPVISDPQHSSPASTGLGQGLISTPSETSATTIQQESYSTDNKKMRGEIAFDNVSFRYALTENLLGKQQSHFESQVQKPDTTQTAPNSLGGTGSGAKQNEKPANGQSANGPLANEQSVNSTSSNGASINGAGSANELFEADSQRNVLNGVSLTVDPGQQVAILGATGSGKSTLVQLIPRFYDVTAGSISIDGVNVREWPLEPLRSQISMVMQQPLLFGGTVRENIAYGRPTASLDEVMAAARAAQAHEFISAMPDGYESRIEAQGANLSGGQRQRMAIARALLVSPAILILDDSTSAVDYETEIKIQDALEKTMTETTVLLIAQRISSVLNADQILVLDEGEIVARGTHEELLASSDIYREIYDSQMGERA